MEKQDIRNYTLEELKKEMVSMGEPVHRAVQIFKWLNQKSVSEFKSMTDLPRLLCNRLDKAFIIGELKVEDHKKSKDGAEKFLWRLRDGKFVESVLIRDNERMTLCLSTQVGCKYRCLFCASGKMNFVRDLEAGEIVGQILQVWRIYGMKPSNIVFMGMGEPFDNYDNLVKALKIINDKDGLGIGARKMTVSTCGIVPGILKLKDIGLQIELSISLHAADNQLRTRLVPVNAKYPIEKVIDACNEYYEKTKRIITFEYVLLKGENDSISSARKLAALTRRVRAKVNLIACSPYPGSSQKAPDLKDLEKFAGILRSMAVMVTIRRSKGADILAACGQLAGKRV